MRTARRVGAYVVASELAVPGDGAAALEAAFTGRLRAVEDHAGFRGLEVWRDSREPGRYLMVSWWRSQTDFLAYMHSDDHDRSHARVPTGPLRPRAVRLSRYEVVAE